MNKISRLVVSFVAFLVAASPALAEGAAAAGSGVGALAPGIAIGLAVLGGGFAIGKANASTLEAISRNPGAASQMQLAWLLGLIFTEAMVIFAFLIAAKLAGLF